MKKEENIYFQSYCLCVMQEILVLVKPWCNWAGNWSKCNYFRFREAFLLQYLAGCFPQALCQPLAGGRKTFKGPSLTQWSWQEIPKGVLGVHKEHELLSSWGGYSPGPSDLHEVLWSQVLTLGCQQARGQHQALVKGSQSNENSFTYSQQIALTRSQLNREQTIMLRIKTKGGKGVLVTNFLQITSVRSSSSSQVACFADQPLGRYSYSSCYSLLSIVVFCPAATPISREIGKPTPIYAKDELCFLQLYASNVTSWVTAGHNRVFCKEICQLLLPGSE